MTRTELESGSSYSQSSDGGEGVPYEEAIRRERIGYYQDPALLSLIENLKIIADPESGDEEKARAREELPDYWEKLMESQLGQLERLLDDFFLRMRNPYPYDSRKGEDWFENIRETSLKARREKWAKNNAEAMAWLERIRADIIWGENNFRLLVGLGPVLSLFFDAVRMLGSVQIAYRSDPVASFYQLTFAKKVPGLGLTEEEKQFLPEGLEGLREQAIKFQDDCAFWRMAVAAVGQLTYDQGGNPETFVALTPKEIKFIQLLFGEEDESKWLEYQGHKFPKSISNWYTLPRVEEEKRRYLATMEYLLTMNIKDKLESEEVDLIAEVQRAKEWIEERLKNWFLPEISLRQRLAAVVVRSGIVFDWGHMSAGQLGWGFRYEKVESTGEIIRKVSLGGTTVATDISTAVLWRLSECNTQRKGWPGGILPPMSLEFMEKLIENPPDWKPEDLEKMAEKDPKLQAAFEELWKDEEGFKWPQELKKYIEELCWYWETPYKDKKGLSLVFPFFLPPVLFSLNFLETITLEEGKTVQGKFQDGTIEEGFPSVWKQLASGKKMSELEWVRMGDQAFYRWLITIAQVAKLLRVMAKPETPDNKGQIDAFFANPGNLKELIKRLDLGTRDERTSPPLLTAVLVPMLVVLYTAKKHGIFGEAGGSKERRTNWIEELAKWSVALSSQPENKGGVNNHRIIMKKMLRFYAALVARLGKIAGEEERRKGTEEYDKLREILGRVVGVGVSATRTVSLKPPVE